MATSQPIADRFIAHYESLYRQHGDSHLAVNWLDPAKARMRYGAMLDLIRPSDLPVTLLDFGCGLGHLYDCILGYDLLRSKIEYSGLDVSKTFVQVCRGKYPDLTFYHLDIFQPDDLCQVPTFDYIVACGTFTERIATPWDDFWSYAQEAVRHLWSHTRKGLAFNVMSIHVDWERGDLFHLPFDLAASFVKQELSRHFLIRQDYGLYEYTIYVYKKGAR